MKLKYVPEVINIAIVKINSIIVIARHSVAHLLCVVIYCYRLLLVLCDNSVAGGGEA